jgi:hypothetical protein
MTYDSSDPRAVEKATKEHKTKEVLRKEGLRQVMSTEPGRAWMHGLLESTGPFRSPYSSDALAMAKNCGEANVGLQLIADLHACSVELYLQMMKENSNG